MSIEIQDELNEVLNEPAVEPTQDVETIEEPKEDIQAEEPTQEEGPAKEPEKPVQQEKKKLSFEERQAQIAKQIKEKHEVLRGIEAEREALRKEREEIEKYKAQYAPKEDLPPDPKNYDPEHPEKYVEDLAEWKASQKLKAEKQRYESETKQRELQQETQKRLNDWEIKTKARVAKDPAFTEKENLVVMVLQQNPNKEMYNAIMDSENNVDLVDYLGQNPEECLRIASTRGIRAAVEIGKLEARIQGRKSQAVSKAPAPINTIKQSNSMGVRNPESMDHGSYSDYMNKLQFGR